MRDKLAKGKSKRITQLNDYLRQDTYKKYGKKLQTEKHNGNTTEARTDTIGISKGNQKEKLLLRLSSKLDPGTHMPLKNKHMQQM